MAGMFYNLGRWVGPKLRKGKWVWSSMTGDEGQLLAAEQECGADLAAAMLDQLGRDPDDSTRRFVRELGDRLAARVANKKRSFAYHVVADGEPNAFALPGGYVFINRSLIELTRRDADEVAFILGHEMAHVIRKDPMQRIMTDATLSAAMNATPARGVLGHWAKRTGTQLLRSAYSQDAELVADKLGARLAQAAGFDPLAAVRMLDRLRRISDAPTEHSLGSYFATHPPFDTRIGELGRYLASKSA